MGRFVYRVCHPISKPAIALGQAVACARQALVQAVSMRDGIQGVNALGMGVRSRSTACGTFVTVIALWLIIATVADAQDASRTVDPKPNVVVQELTSDLLQQRLKKVEDSKDLDAALKTKLIDSYTKALEQLKLATEASARSEQYSRLMREAPESLRLIRNELAAPAVESGAAISADATLSQAQQLLSKAEAGLGESQKALQAAQDEPKRRADRRLEIPKLADAAKLQLQELEKQLDLKPAADEAPELTAAQRALLETRKKAIVAESASQQIELQYYEATGELLSAQRDRAARRVSEADSQVASLRGLVNDRRKQEAERQAIEARQASAQSHPAVREIANANALLANGRQALAAKIETATREYEQIDRQVIALQDQVKRVTKRIETAGSTEAIGLLLRKQRADLPDVASHQRKIKPRAEEISDIYLKLIDFEESRNELATLDRRVRDVVEGLRYTVSSNELPYVEAEVQSVLEAQRSVMDSLIADTNSYLDKLVELDVRERQLINVVNDYADYCSERILWIRSTVPVSTSNLKQVNHALIWLIDRANWQRVIDTLRDEIAKHPGLAAIALLLFLVLLACQRALRARLAEMGELAARSNTRSILPTVRSLLIVLLMSALWPGVIGAIGFGLVAADQGEFVDAVGKGLEATALVFVTLEFFRHVCRRGGLGESHFGWPPESLELIRRSLRRFMMLGLPCVFVVAATEAQQSELIKNSLGRAAFIGFLAVLALQFHRMTRATNGMLAVMNTFAPSPWYVKVQRAVHLVAIGLPMLLGVLAILGYYYTAIEFAWRMLASVWLLGGVLVAYATSLRWVLMTYRDLAMRRARERRANPIPNTGDSASPVTTAAASLDVSLANINKQTRKALQLVLAAGLLGGLWLVWGNVLPALGVLKRVDLWVIDQVRNHGNGTTTVLQAITLADLLFGVMVLMLTFAGSRYLPILLEFIVLQRLPLDPGVRYAVSRVSKYLVTVAGVIFAFSAIGIGWSKVQWLVAAISVGLGFGLQEIFANFISGLILLFEQPVRLGDIVTVADTTGTVTQIHMRATTITDADMRELVVPNREFITGKVMNWTLSSTLSRMTIKVGVAYGTDPDQVRQLLLDIAGRHPLVLKDPRPQALLDEFAESTLGFLLLVYMSKRDIYMQLRHELHVQISKAFRDAGIEIAFPQQEIHIRSSVVVPPAVATSRTAAPIVAPSLPAAFGTESTVS